MVEQQSWNNKHAMIIAALAHRYLRVEMRRRIDGGAAPCYYRLAHGRPQYYPDWYGQLARNNLSTLQGG